MTYSYQSGSNKLSGVADAITTANKLGDFTDVNTSGDDYLYDVNGNMEIDKNKSIYGTSSTTKGIFYNYLNLPYKILVSGKGTIYYDHDAEGNKLAKKVVEGSTTTETLYMNGFELKNEVLQIFGHEEGRIRPDGNGGFVYDYFLKDHLGNVRMVLTEEQKTDIYPAATMETATATTEETYYSNLVTTRTTAPSGYPANTPSGNVNVANVHAPVSGGIFSVVPQIGPGIVLKVMAGDHFNVAVNAWYMRARGGSGVTQNPISEILTTLATGIAGQPGTHSSATELATSTVLSDAVTSFVSSYSGSSSSYPPAFLNWMLLDEHFNLVSSSSGFEQVTTDATYLTLGGTNKPIEKSGYLYVFVSNSAHDLDVYFDNLQVSHVRGPLLEENHYYPWGLNMAGISSKALNFGDPGK